MNPFSDVCKKCLVVGHLCTKWYFGADSCYLFQVNNISSNHSVFSTLVMFRWGQFKKYWNGGNAFMLMPCDSNHCCISAYQPWISPSIFSQFYWWQKCQPWVPSFRELPKMLDTGRRSIGLYGTLNKRIERSWEMDSDSRHTIEKCRLMCLSKKRQYKGSMMKQNGYMNIMTTF